MSDDFSGLRKLFLETVVHQELDVDSNTRTLRCGSSHFRLPSFNSVADRPTDTTTMPDHNTPNVGASSLPQMKVLSQQHNVSAFTGEDPNFTALDFISQCEDTFSSVMALAPKDKIVFIKQQLPKTSLAFELMKGWDLKEASENSNYDAFKALFLSVFDEDKIESIVKVLSASVDDIAKDIGSLDVRRAVVPATRLTENAMRILKSAEWSSGDSVSLEKVAKFLNLFHYLIFLRTNIRLASLSLTYKPEERMHDFCTNVSTKLTERQGEAAGPVVAAVSETSISSTAATSTTGPAGRTGAVPRFCSYCNRNGHTLVRCHQRMNDQRAKKKWVPRGQAASRPQPAAASTAPATQSAAPLQRPPRVANKRCDIHGMTSHSTSECYTVQRCRNNFLERRAAPALPTEAPPPSTPAAQT